MNSVHVLYASVDSAQEGVGSSQIVPLVIALKKKGVNISLLTFEKSTPKTSLIHELARHEIPWFFFPFRYRGIFSVLYRFVTLMFYSRRYHLVHARSDFVALAASFTSTPFLWDIRSFWSMQRQKMTHNPVKKFVLQMFHKIEFFIFWRSSAFTTLTSVANQYLSNRFKNRNKISDIIPTIVDLSLFQLRPFNPHSKIGLISGTFSDLYDLPLTIQLINAFRDNYAYEFIWARPEESKNFDLSDHVDKVLTLKRHQMVELIKKSTFGLALCVSNGGTDVIAAMPTKLGEFLATGRPIIVSQGLGDFDHIINEYRVGITVSASDSLEQKLQDFRLLLEDEMLAFRCRFVAESFFSLDTGADKYISIYKKILEI